MRRELGNRSLALKVELRIKKLSRKAKEKLIENPKVIDEIALACQVGAS
jgi:predicted GIY-YIG superfamily endonuclease|tara:strand:+ start:1626 stop:1772 length:147 start_codon:yes stop_codon:yes gene_type:complete